MIDPLEYHKRFPAGKIAIQSTKPVSTQEELSVAYSPGVAVVCEEIYKNPETVWDYTGRGNTVAIITEGSAILGLGNLGPLAAMPVMEGKSVLFKKFADIDCIPLCLQFKSKEYVEEFVNAVKPLEPSFGGINLEDIKAPICFAIEERLEAEMEIPVFHDDQHGTAVILTAALMNALKLTGRELSKIKLVMNGAGAAGIAFAKMITLAGLPKSQLFLCDTQGLVTQGRADSNKYKAEFAQKGEAQTLAEVMVGADVFVGVSAAGAVTQDMVRSMAKDPILFAVANPIPEIMPELAYAAGAKIVGTGRSDFPNQVNNVLGFPGIFRGTLDTRACRVNQAMKVAAAEALASLVYEPVTGKFREVLEQAYPQEKELFSRENPFCEQLIIPKPFDLRVVPRVARKVAEAAMKSGVARKQIEDLDQYEQDLLKRLIG